MNKILTIVIPTYNMENYLDKCLSSLIISDEKMQLLEVLIINDGSKDRSSEIGHSYEYRYPQTFRVIDKENGNYGSCINRGLKEATGKYIKVLDADDFFYTPALKNVMSFLSTANYDLILNDNNIINEEGNVINIFGFNLEKNKEYSSKYLTGDVATSMKMHTLIYKTANIRSINYKQTEGISYTDQEWMFLPMTTVKSFFYHNEILYQYLVGREGQSVNPKILANSINQYISVVLNLAKIYSTYKGSPETTNYLYLRVKSQSLLIYERCICKYNGIDMRILIDFDDKIKKMTPDVYTALNSCYYAKCIYYIYLWRKLGRPTKRWFTMINNRLFHLRPKKQYV